MNPKLGNMELENVVGMLNVGRTKQIGYFEEVVLLLIKTYQTQADAQVYKGNTDILHNSG